MIRRILKVLAVIVVVLILLVVGVWFLLQPPVLAVPSQKRLVFFNVTVVNPGRDRRAERTLTIQDGQIVAITANPHTISESEAGTRFAGFYVLPGLIDMHVHQFPLDSELYGLLFLAHGVTTVRNTGDFSGTILKKRQQIQDGAYPGPRIFACGPIIDGDPPWWPGSRVVRTVAEAQAAVDDVAAAGVDCVKVYGRLSSELLAAIREAAARHKLPVVGHIPQMKAVVRRLYQAGVRIHTGSDTPNPFVVPGASLHEELHLLVEAGLTPEEVWVAATRWPGETLGMAKLGTVQEGAPADFLLFREDPTRDLTALSTLEAVVAQGRLYPKAVLDAALTRHRDYFNGWLYDRLSMVYARWLASRISIDER